MKWTLLLMIIATLLIISGCSDNKTTFPINTKPVQTYSSEKNVTIMQVPGTIDEIDFNLILSGNGPSMVLSSLGTSEKQAIISQGKYENVTVTFDGDGNSTFINNISGATAIQDNKGLWVIVTKDGTIGQLGGKWTDNQYTKQLTAPTMPIAMTVDNDTSFSVTFVSATIKELKAYVQIVKGDGFTNNIKLVDQVIDGIDTYSYAATNADNYKVEIFSTAGVSGLMISKATN